MIRYQHNPLLPPAYVDAMNHRLASGLTESQVIELLSHSFSSCDQCSDFAPVYELDDRSPFDRTIWNLCRVHHATPDHKSLYLDEGYQQFLTDPLADTYQEHLVIENEAPADWWGVNE